MAASRPHSRVDFGQLPAELIRAVFRDAGAPSSLLSLKDRVAALGVCKAWQAALKDLPLARLELDRDDKELCKWAILAQPPLLALEVFCGEAYPDLLPLLLHALPHKALRKLEWGWNSVSLTKALPYPAMLSNLEHLDAGVLSPDPAWLQQLTALRQLAQLTLCFDMGLMAGGPAPSPVQLPSLPGLVSLVVELSGAPVLGPGLRLDLDLGRLQSLEILEVSGENSMLVVAPGSAPASKLHRLRIDVDQLSLDFAQLPALESADLGSCLDELQSAASIAACSSLSRLRLGDSNSYDVDLDYPWVAELLGNAPSSLRQLSVGGLWAAEAAVAVGALEHLEGLSVEGLGAAPVLLPPESSAVWRNLRALRVRHGYGELPLPQVIRYTTHLEALQAPLSSPSYGDLDLLSSLPSLRKLAVEAPEASEAVMSSAHKALRRLMPQLQEVRVEQYVSLNVCRFFEWAFSM